MVGKSIAQRYPDAQFGHHLHFGRGDWQIVGIMDGGQSAVNSEIWGDLNQVSSDYNREDNLSSILVRASDAAAVPSLIKAIDDDRQLNLSGIPEPAYYASQTSSGAPLEFLGILVAIIMAIGSSFAAMNTMYAAVSRRSQEIGTLRVLGFSRASILVSFPHRSVVAVYRRRDPGLSHHPAVEWRNNRRRQLFHIQRNRLPFPRRPLHHGRRRDLRGNRRGAGRILPGAKCCKEGDPGGAA